MGSSSGRMRAMKLTRIAYWPTVFLVCAQVIAVYVALEIGYRWYRHHIITGQLFQMFAAQTTASKSGASAKVPDRYSGYRYAANVEGQLGYPWFSHWRTNSHAHRSNEEYPIKKPDGEFRIAAVGDSFTANITSNVSWTDELQRHLNGSSRWRDAIAGRFTRVINFGIDGTGIEQYRGVVLHHVPPFEPDLIIINFATDDILRRMPRWRDGPPLTREQSIREAIREYLVAIDWYEPCSLLFTATIGHYWDAECV